MGELKKRVASVEVYVSSLYVQEYTDMAKLTKSDVFSSVGGFVGLLLGISVLTFIELLEGILTIVQIVYNKRKSNLKRIQVRPIFQNT